MSTNNSRLRDGFWARDYPLGRKFIKCVRSVMRKEQSMYLRRRRACLKVDCSRDCQISRDHSVRRDVSSASAPTCTHIHHTVSDVVLVKILALECNPRVACGAESMERYGVRLSVCPSVPFARRTPLLQVCCCGPGGQEISIDCFSSGGQCHVVNVRR